MEKSAIEVVVEAYEKRIDILEKKIDDECLVSTELMFKYFCIRKGGHEIVKIEDALHLIRKFRCKWCGEEFYEKENN